MGAAGKTPVKSDLLVIGAGPCGLAALYQARARGLVAVGIEAGSCSAYSIAGYLDGLAVLSPPFHYEIGGLPLDCRDPTSVTREELLHYYARVINHGRLDIRYGVSCARIEKLRDGSVAVHAQGKEIYLAANVIVTAWYEKKPVHSMVSRSKPGARIFSEGIKNPIQVAGQRTVVVGGGISGVEQAASIMRCGQSVVLLARGACVIAPPEFKRLLRQTNSSLIEGVKEIFVKEGHVSFIKDGKRGRLPADAVVFATGTRLSEKMLELLRVARVLKGRQVSALLRAEKKAQIMRRATPPRARLNQEREQVRILARVQPDLTRLLFVGVNRVRVAGGVLHWGAARSAVSVSILTAGFAVDSIVGASRKPPTGMPLVEFLWRYLLRQRRRFPGAPPLTMEAVGDLRPCLIDNWSRHTISIHVSESETPASSGVQGPGANGELDYFLVARGLDRKTILFILRHIDGNRSVEDIAKLTGFSDAAGLPSFFSALRTLWCCNSLSWRTPSAVKVVERGDRSGS